MIEIKYNLTIPTSIVNVYINSINLNLYNYNDND